MEYYYDPLNPACKSITGGIKEGETLKIKIFTVEKLFNGSTRLESEPKNAVCPQGNAFFLIEKDGESGRKIPMNRTENGWELSFSEEKGLYFYTFAFDNGYLKAGNDSLGAFSTDYPKNEGEKFRITVSKADYLTPQWFKGGVMYQIFPDRFHKSDLPKKELANRILRDDWGGLPAFLADEHGKIKNNDYFGGDFKGIEEKLEYLSDLGITVIYLNPIFYASSNHRYDTSDYMQVDPYLGTEEDFSSLVKKADERGIKIILDGVFNHTGDDSVYFNKYGNFPSVGAYQSKESDYYAWYNFIQYPDKYACWWGIDILPEINENSESYQNFIFGNNGVIKKWLSDGIFGYRLDVADELPDFFLEKLRKSVKESNSNAIIIGEVWEDASDKIAYSTRRKYLQGAELDSVMNYPWKDALIGYLRTGKAEILANSFLKIIDRYPKDTVDVLMNILGTHDTVRILTVLGGKTVKNKEEMAYFDNSLSGEELEKAINLLKIASVIQFTLPGVPCVYYGDENAMQGYSDPFCRKCFDWENTNFEILEHYKLLGNIRKSLQDVYTTGKYRQIYLQNGLFVFARIGENRTAYTFSNVSGEKFVISLNKGVELLSGKIVSENFSVEPFSCGIILSE